MTAGLPSLGRGSTSWLTPPGASSAIWLRRDRDAPEGGTARPRMSLVRYEPIRAPLRVFYNCSEPGLFHSSWNCLTGGLCRRSDPLISSPWSEPRLARLTGSPVVEHGRPRPEVASLDHCGPPRPGSPAPNATRGQGYRHCCARHRTRSSGLGDRGLINGQTARITCAGREPHRLTARDIKPSPYSGAP